jgi:putative thiamine transport system permease protein
MIRLRTISGALPLALIFLLPLFLSLALLLPGLTDRAALVAMFDHPQFNGAVKLTLITGFAATAIALGLAILVLQHLSAQTQSQAGFLLAVPHLAFAIGLGFLIAPTGLLARLIAITLTGWTSPPQWQTTQDPHGIALTLALVLKELPFLVWAMSSVLQQDEMRLRLRQEILVAQSLGHDARAAFFRIVLPQVLQRSLWPLIAVFAYSMTVVDMALVIGPTQPPLLAQLVWTDLNDGDGLTNARGAAGTLVLTGVTCLALLAVTLLLRMARPLVSRWMTRAPSPRPSTKAWSLMIWRTTLLIYALVIAALLLQSISTLWPFPELLAKTWTASQLLRIIDNPAPVLTSLALAACTSVTALAAVIVWLESQTKRFDRIIFSGAWLALCLPALLLALGHYRLLLHLNQTGTFAGLLLVHLIPVTAYVFIMLQGPYRAYDSRWQSVAAGAGARHMRFLFRVKWPMLKASLASAWAVGFSVSLAQFVSAQLAAAGRHTTLPIEAVTLTSGGNRALLASYGLVLMLLPLLGFALASRLGKPRWKTT